MCLYNSALFSCSTRKSWRHAIHHHGSWDAWGDSRHPVFLHPVGAPFPMCLLPGPARMESPPLQQWPCKPSDWGWKVEIGQILMQDLQIWMVAYNMLAMCILSWVPECQIPIWGLQWGSQISKTVRVEQENKHLVQNNTISDIISASLNGTGHLGKGRGGRRT